MIIFRNKNSNIAFSYLCIQNYVYTQTIDYMQNPVATGYVITDNAVLMPGKLVINAIIDNTHNDVVLSLKTVVDSQQEFSANFDNIYLPNIYIESVEYEQSIEVANTYTVNINFIQIISAKVSISTYSLQQVKNPSSASPSKTTHTPPKFVSNSIVAKIGSVTRWHNIKL